MKMTAFAKYAAASAFFCSGMLCAETMYWASNDWDHFNNQSAYVDENNVRYPASDTWSHADADIIFDPSKMSRDNFVGIKDDMTIKSLTFMDATGKFNHYWWAQRQEGYENGEGKTLTITEDLNFYYAVKNNNTDKRIHIAANNVNINVTANVANVDGQGPVIDLRALNSLVVGNDMTVSRVGADGKGNIDLGWTGVHSSDSSRRGVYIGGNLSLANMGQFYANNTKVFDVVGNFTAESTVGKIVVQEMESFHVGGNLTASYNEWLDVNNTGKKMEESTLVEYIGGIEVGGMLKKTGGGGVNADDSGFLKIGGDAVFEDATLRFERVGRVDGKVTGNIEIGYDADRLGSQHGGSLVVTNGSIQGTEAGNISINKDLLITDGEIQAARSGVVNIGGNLIINNTSHRVSQFNDDGADITVGGNIALTKSNLYAWKRGDIKIGGTFSADDTSAILFDGVKSINVNGGDMILGAEFQAREIGYLKVKGNLGIGGDAKIFAREGVNGGVQSADNAGVDVDGLIKMNGGQLGAWFHVDSADPDKYAKNLYVKSGGIDGTGSLYVSNEKANATDNFSVTYVLDNAGDSAFTGGIFQYKSGGSSVDPADFEKMNLNIIKKGAGTQSLIVNEAGSMWRGKVALEGGRLNLYTIESDYIKVDLDLNQDTVLDVAYAKPGAHNPDTDMMGYISAGTVKINGDVSILFDASKHPDPEVGYESDWIKADEVTGSGIATLVIDLDANFFEEGQELENLELKIFEVANNDYDWAQAIIKIMYRGEDISSSFDRLAYYSQEKDNGVFVVLNGIVVPEPAAVAAVLGALALGLAVLRRRK